MPFRKLIPCLSWLRLLALAILLLAVVANPVLAAVGDLHEAVQGVATHLDQSQAHALVADVEDHDDAGDLLHALMHASHCCGHLTAIPSSFALATLSLPMATHFVGMVAAPGSHIPSLSLRPPIAA